MDRNFLTSCLFLQTLRFRFREDILKPCPFSTYYIKKENRKKLNVWKLLNVATGLSFFHEGFDKDYSVQNGDWSEEGES